MNRAETSGHYDALVRVVVVGNAGVGKTSLLRKFSTDEFVSEEDYSSTLGVDFMHKIILVNKKHVKIQLWDTAGQERFRSITSSFYRLGNVILLVFDVTNIESYSSIAKWIGEIQIYKQKECEIILIANKCDDTKHREIDPEHIALLEKKFGLPCVETSAKTAQNLDELFNIIAVDYIKKSTTTKKQTEPNLRVELNSDSGSSGIRRSFCC